MKLDNPLLVPKRSEFPDLSTLGRRSERTEGFPARSLARQHPAALLQLSHHGRHRDFADSADAVVGLVAVARTPLPKPAAAVGSAAGFAFPLHRNHRRLDDRGTGPPAVADLWTDAHRRGIFPTCLRGQWTVHAHRIHGVVSGAGHFVPLLDSPRDRAWTRARARSPPAWRSINDRHSLVLPGRDHDRRLRRPGWIRSRRRHRPSVCRPHRLGNGGRFCSPSVRSGTATRSGCWPAAAHCTLPSPLSIRRPSAVFIWR